MAMLLIKCWQSSASRGAEQPLLVVENNFDEDCDDGDDDDYQGEGGEGKGRWFSKPLSVNAAKSNTFMLHPLKF